MILIIQYMESIIVELTVFVIIKLDHPVASCQFTPLEARSTLKVTI